MDEEKEMPLGLAFQKCKVQTGNGTAGKRAGENVIECKNCPSSRG